MLKINRPECEDFATHFEDGTGIGKFGIFHRQTASLLKGHSIMIGYERGNPEKAQLLTSKYGTRFT